MPILVVHRQTLIPHPDLQLSRQVFWLVYLGQYDSPDIWLILLDTTGRQQLPNFVVSLKTTHLSKYIFAYRIHHEQV
jgi:hypothetical protein